MAKVPIINGSKDLITALPEFQKYMNLPFDFHPFDKTQPPPKDSFMIVQNQIPEKLDGLKLLSSLRASSGYCAVPVIFITDPLSDAAKILLGDTELITIVELPFNSHDFFQTAAGMLRFVKESEEFLTKRQQVEMLIAKKKFSDAQKLFNTIADKYSDQFAKHILETRILMGNGQAEQALITIEKSVKIQPKSLKAINLKASALVSLGRNDLAKEVLDSASEISNLQLENLLHWGDEYLKRGNADKATMSYLKVTEIDKENQRAKEGMLASEILSGRKQTVQSSLEDSAMSIELARICNLKAIAMVNSGQLKAAQTLYMNAMNFMSENDDTYKIWMNLGLCMKKGKKYKEAVRYFERCKVHAPDDFTKADSQIQHTKNLLEVSKNSSKKKIANKVTKKPPTESTTPVETKSKPKGGGTINYKDQG